MSGLRRAQMAGLVNLINNAVGAQLNPYRAQTDQQLTLLNKRVDELSKRVDLATAVKPRRRLTPFKILQIIGVLVGVLQITAFVFNLSKRNALPPSSTPRDDYKVKRDDDT